MTEEERLREEKLREENPWKDFTVPNQLELYKQGGKQCYSKDLNLLLKSNAAAEAYEIKQGKEKRSYIYHLELPPCPWDGNPLKANVIFLSLNPGYVEDLNKNFSKLVASNVDLNERVLAFRRATLNLNAPLRPTYVQGEEPMTTLQAVEMMDDVYWTNKFKTILKTTQIPIDHFTERVSVMQYIAYTSENYKDLINGEHFPSQEFTKELIKFRLENAKDDELPVFVVMRARDEWENFLGDLIKNYKKHFIFRKKMTVTRNGKSWNQGMRSQFINANAFEKPEDWELIIKAVRTKTNS